MFLLTVQRRCFICGTFLLFVFRVCRVFLSVHCSLVVTYWEKTDLFALFCVVFCCVFVVFPSGVLGQVWCLIVSIPDPCLLSYFYLGSRIALTDKKGLTNGKGSFLQHRQC